MGKSKDNRRAEMAQSREERFIDRSELRPLNDRQKEYISAIRNNPVVICIGVWGSSKTYIPSVMAADMFLAKKIDKIIIARPTEGKGKTVGFLKGTAEEKLEPWCAPILDTLRERLGRTRVDSMVEHGKLLLMSLEHIKGRSWDDAMIIVDEAEDLEPTVAKSLVGRQGIRSKVVITGDIAQQDILENSGLQVLLDVVEFNNSSIPVIDFDSWEYCVRSDEAKNWGIMFENYERSKGRIK